MKNNYVQQSFVNQMLTDRSWPQRKTDARLSLIYNFVLVEAITYVNLQRNLIHLQQIWTNKDYYELSYFPYIIKHRNCLPKPLLSIDRLKAFKTGVVVIDHHLSYQIQSTNTVSFNKTQMNVFIHIILVLIVKLAIIQLGVKGHRPFQNLVYHARDSREAAALSWAFNAHVHSSPFQMAGPMPFLSLLPLPALGGTHGISFPSNVYVIWTLWHIYKPHLGRKKGCLL